MNDLLALALTVLLLLANGFFVAAEFALVSARRAEIEPRVESGSRRAVVTLHAMENVSLMMAGAQLGITVCSLALGSLSEPAIAHLIESPFGAAGLPDGLLHPVAFAIALAIVTVLHVLIGEMVPKNIALAGPGRVALALTPILATLVRGVRPVIIAMNASANAVLRLLRVTPRDEVVSAFTRDQVADLVEQSRREGMIDADEHELLVGALAFDAAAVGEAMIPLNALQTVAPGASAAEIEERAVRTGFSRFPVEVGDDLVGYVHVRDVLDGTSALVRPLPDIALDAGLPAALEVMRAAGVALVRVVDGTRTLGVLTLDDVLGRLVDA